MKKEKSGDIYIGSKILSNYIMDNINCSDIEEYKILLFELYSKIYSSKISHMCFRYKEFNIFEDLKQEAYSCIWKLISENKFEKFDRIPYIILYLKGNITHYYKKYIVKHYTTLGDKNRLKLEKINNNLDNNIEVSDDDLKIKIRLESLYGSISNLDSPTNEEEDTNLGDLLESKPCNFDRFFIVEKLKDAISKLKIEDSTILSYFMLGYNDSEIGIELNKSRTTIRDRRKKILRDLKEHLLDLGIDEDILKEIN